MIKVKLEVDGKSIEVIVDDSRTWGSSVMKEMVEIAVEAIQTVERKEDE